MRAGKAVRHRSTAIGQVSFTFLGTASAIPTLRRNVTSSVLRADGEAFVFDAGEGTQHQLLRAQTVRQGKIKRIFITHMHGDHVFGLPGLVTGLCGVKKDMARDRILAGKGPDGDEEKLRIYGPRGVREFLATALRLSRMKIPRDFVVHELCETREEALSSGMPLHDASDEHSGHTVVAPDEEGTWNLVDNGAYSVRAGAITHTVPCWGYVWEEASQPGALDVVKLMATSLGSRRVGPWLAELKSGKIVDGVRREDVCGPPLKGRKVAILGDTCDGRGVAHLAQGCNLLIHEATMTDAMRRKAVQRGHSTAAMAGTFARLIKARELAVTHFGGEISANVDNRMHQELAASVKRVFGKQPVIARDFLTIQIDRDKTQVLGELRRKPGQGEEDLLGAGEDD